MLKESLNLLGRYIIFWLILFAINRVLFGMLYWSDLTVLPSNELAAVLWMGIKLDLATISYFALLPCLVLFLNGMIPHPTTNKVFNEVVRYYTFLLLVVVALLHGAEAGLYEEWGTKMNFTALEHLKNMSEVAGTVSGKHILYTLLFIAVGSVGGGWLYVKYFYRKVSFQPYSWRQVVANLLGYPACFVLAFIGLRGGFNAIPINISAAYYSSHAILNDLATNSVFNLAENVKFNARNFEGNPYSFFDTNEANAVVDSLYRERGDTTRQVFNQERPNVVFLILESWSSDLVGSLGGSTPVTPQFDALAQEGYLFENYYAAGWTSDQGIPGILSAAPVFPYVAIVNQTNKSRSLPCLNKSLERANYSSSFYFGGQLNYGNIKGYLLNQGFQTIKEQNDFKGYKAGRLGIHDGDMFEIFRQELNQKEGPFFSCLFTLSSHSPYDMPHGMGIEIGGKHNDYLNSVGYADSALGEFFNKAKTEPWYDNTIFVIMADHSHNTPANWPIHHYQHFKIPLLLYGKPLKQEYQGKIHTEIVSQLDVPATLLSQLKIDHSEYRWSKDIFQVNAPQFAPYAFYKGYAMVTPEARMAYSVKIDRMLLLEGAGDTTNLIQTTRAFNQVSFDQYLSF